MGFFELSVRALFSFLALYIMCRILGKKLIAQLTFFDFVAGVSLGTIAGGMILDNRIPLALGLYGLVLFGAFALLMDFISLKSYKGRKVLNDEPTLLVKNGKILEEEMAKARLTVDELLFQLRKENIFYLDEVEMAIFETDGTISALKKSALMPPTKQELQLHSPSRGVPQTFIVDGNLLPNKLREAGKDEEWVQSILRANGIGKISDIVVAQIDEQGNVFIDIRKDNCSL